MIYAKVYERRNRFKPETGNDDRKGQGPSGSRPDVSSSL